MKEVHFGSDGVNLYLRVDFHPGYEQELFTTNARLTAESLDGARSNSVTFSFAQGSLHPAECVLVGGR